MCFLRSLWTSQSQGNNLCGVKTEQGCSSWMKLRTTSKPCGLHHFCSWWKHTFQVLGFIPRMGKKNNKHVEQEKEERIRGEGGRGIEGEIEGGRHHWYLTLIMKTRIWCTSLSMWSDCLNIRGENSCFLIYIAQRYFQAVSRLCLQFLSPLWSGLFPSLCHNLHLNSRVLLDNPLNVDPTSVQADSHCPFTM